VYSVGPDPTCSDVQKLPQRIRESGQSSGRNLVLYVFVKRVITLLYYQAVSLLSTTNAILFRILPQV
jgi:hypothetical protein